MIRNYLLVALRNLLRHKVFSFINVAGLSIGLACCALIFLYVKDELSFDRFHQRAPRLYRVNTDYYHWGSLGDHPTPKTGLVQAPAFQREIPEIEAYVRIQGGNGLVKKGNEALPEPTLYADANFFTVFSFPLRQGNPRSVLQPRNGVVVTARLAEKYFGTTDVVGKTLEIQMDDIFERYLITGVAENTPRNSSIQFDVLLPYQKKEAYDIRHRKPDDWVSSFLTTFLLLNPRADPRVVEAKFPAVLQKYAGKQLADMRTQKDYARFGIQYRLQPLRAVHLANEYGPSGDVVQVSDKLYSYILSGIAGLILVIACINFVNLTLARSLSRNKEIGIRKTAGGTQGQLMKQFLGEAFLLNSLAFIPALVLVDVLLPFFNQLTNKKLAFSYLLDHQLVAGFGALLLLNTLLAGFYPAWVLSRQNPVQALSGRQKLLSRNYLGRSLVVVQFGLAIFLVVATFTFGAQFRFLLNKDLGYDDQNVLNIRIPFNEAGFAKSFALRDELRNYSTLFESVAGLSGVTSLGVNTTSVEINGRKMETIQGGVDENYLTTFRIPLVAGRNFSTAVPFDSANAVLVNETFAKAVGWKEPLGQQITWWDQKTSTVIGVIKDVHLESLKNRIRPALFTRENRQCVEVCVKIKPGQILPAIQRIQQTYRQLLPFQPLEYVFMNEVNARLYESEARWKQIITYSAAMTVFVACIGLFGLATLSIQQRTKEIGIRKVLGATVSNIVTLLSTDFLRLVAVAFAVAIPVAWWAMNRWLQDFAYRIDIGWEVFTGVGITTLLMVVLTVSYQAIRAAMANPVQSLRTE
ncbi:MAG: ABC transporter permease [Ferruginibacter sp.]|nr:ABC transporter permease [Cytophagales bacterium]